jgi:hypothetical protein
MHSESLFIGRAGGVIPLGRTRIPASWEWRKVGPGHYLVKGFVIRRARRGCWETTHVSRTVGLVGMLRAALDDINVSLAWR